MPFFSGGLPDGAQMDDSALIKVEAMISSMTKAERKSPELIETEKGRAERIGRAQGLHRKR